MTDNRIVLPLDRALLLAERYCGSHCGNIMDPPGEKTHAAACIHDLLAERDRMLAGQPEVGRVSGDCQDPVKHLSCHGCVCGCHRGGGVYAADVVRTISKGVVTITLVHGYSGLTVTRERALPLGRPFAPEVHLCLTDAWQALAVVLAEHGGVPAADNRHPERTPS